MTHDVVLVLIYTISLILCTTLYLSTQNKDIFNT